MGSMYTKQLSAAGWKKVSILGPGANCYSIEPVFTRIHVCDLPGKTEALRAQYKGVVGRVRVYFVLSEAREDNPGIYVLDDGHAVSRTSDLIIYSVVEAEHIGSVVRKFGPCDYTS